MLKRWGDARSKEGHGAQCGSEARAATGKERADVEKGGTPGGETGDKGIKDGREEEGASSPEKTSPCQVTVHGGSKTFTPSTCFPKS